MKNKIKKYQLHYYLLALILLSIIIIVISNFFPVNQDQIKFDINKWIGIKSIQISVNNYIYYLLIIFSSLILYLIPKKFQWIWLLLINLIFLILWDLFFVFVLLFITLLTFYFGKTLAKDIEKKNPNNKLLYASIIIIITLFSLKYISFFSCKLPIKILMPLGLSYVSFQGLSYLFDINSRKIKSEKHFGFFCLYMIFFPKLFIGPIERSKNFLEQIRNGIQFNSTLYDIGIYRIILGLFKKIMLVNRLSVLVDQFFNNPTQFNKAEHWFLTIALSFYIYLDFSAYTDIALGSANLFGIKFMENFNQPYFSKSISEFWKRWHISFSTWIRDYIFTPLNFSTRRIKDNSILYINLMITFLISGIWHGASLNFMIWGGLHGAAQIVSHWSKPYLATITRKNTPLENLVKIILTFIFVSLTWILFKAENFTEALLIWNGLFSKDISGPLMITKFNLDIYDLIITIIIVLMFIGLDIINELKIDIIDKFQKLSLVIKWIILLIIIFSMIIFGYYGSSTVNIDPFYMQF